MPKVLVIDDSPTVRMFYRATLEPAGFCVDEALNGLEGLEKAMTSSFDLLIVDVNMPLMDGYTFLSELRRRKETSDVPAIVVSTLARPQDRARAHAHGANAYFIKPINPDVLVEYGRLMTGAPARLGRVQ